MKFYYLIVVFFFSISLYSQVGINTTNPSPASVLDVNSSSDGVRFGGFLPPRVSSIAERTSINPGISDIGLLIFLKDAVNNDFCFQIWNGSTWENIYCITTPVIYDIASQDFDNNITWTYTNTPVFYNMNGDVWDIVNVLPNITVFSGNFLGCRDLNNSNGGGNFLHELNFNSVNVSSFTNVQITFEYSVFDFDGEDDVYYELFLDTIGQGQIQLIDGANGGGVTENGTVVINVPNGTTSASLKLSIKQNGNDDMGGFDNFKIIGL